MSLNYSALASSINTEYEDIKTTPDIPAGPRWMEHYKTSYDGDAMAGTFSAASVVMVSNPSLLEFGVSNDPSTNSNWGASLASYWSSQLTPGVPQVCGAITSVTNDASKIESPIISYLASLGDTERNPPYEHIFEFIENQVKSIIWTVTESDGSPCNSTYTVTIS
jgi:hypothetical protein